MLCVNVLIKSKYDYVSVPYKLERHIFHLVFVYGVKSLLLDLAEQILPVSRNSWQNKTRQVTLSQFGTSGYNQLIFNWNNS